MEEFNRQLKEMMTKTAKAKWRNEKFKARLTKKTKYSLHRFQKTANFTRKRRLIQREMILIFMKNVQITEFVSHFQIFFWLQTKF